MSITCVGASSFLTTPPPRSGDLGGGQANRSNAQNSYSNSAADSATSVSSNNVTHNAVNGTTAGSATNADKHDVDASSSPPPTQSVTAPGTGLKVNIIA